MINKITLILIMTTTMMLANLLFFFNLGYENQYSQVSIIIFIVLSSLYILKNYQTTIFKISKISNLLLLFITTLTIFGILLLSDIANISGMTFKILSLSKILFFYFIILLISQLNTEDINIIIKKNISLFIFIIIITLIIFYLDMYHVIHLKDRLIAYQDRFAALCFELVDFTYLLFILLILLYKNNKYWLLQFIAVLYLLSLTKSNSIVIYLAALTAYLIVYNFKFIRKKIFIFLSLIFFVILYIFSSVEVINSILAELSVYLPRIGASLDPSSPAYGRIMPNVEALLYLKDNFINIPSGIFSSKYLFTHAESVQGSAAGILIFLVDFGIIGIFILIILFYLVSKLLYNKINNLNIFKAEAIIFVSAIYLIFQPSYLNFTIWTIILLATRYITLTKYKIDLERKSLYEKNTNIHR
jgi:hypothetical protein